VRMFLYEPLQITMYSGFPHNVTVEKAGQPDSSGVRFIFHLGDDFTQTGLIQKCFICSIRFSKVTSTTVTLYGDSS
jgi:hypothetical protein